MPTTTTADISAHLSYREKTNLGSFYTPLHIVRRVYREKVTIAVCAVIESVRGLDSACAMPLWGCDGGGNAKRNGHGKLPLH